MDFPRELTQFTDPVEIGRGGMGVVFRARYRELQRDVAIKFLDPQAGGDSQVRSRFIEEARLAGRIRHANVVMVMQSGITTAGSLYLVYELLEGQDLSEVLERRGRLPAAEAVQLMASALEGLEAIHAAGIIHRDLKPANIFVTAGGPKIVDFGIARNLLDALVRTQTGMLLGTPQYVSPEAVKGEEVSAASDVYSAGIVLFELLAGKTPFKANALAEHLAHHIHTPAPRVDAVVGDVPAALADAVNRALAKDPAQRPSVPDFRLAILAAIGDAKDAPPAAAPGRPSSRVTHSRPSASTRALGRTVASRGDVSTHASSVLGPMPTRTQLWTRAAVLMLVTGVPLFTVTALRHRTAEPPASVATPSPDLSSAAPPAGPRALEVDAEHQACGQLGLLVMLKEEERRRDDPAQFILRTGYLRRALDALLPPDAPGATRDATWTATARLVCALLADEARAGLAKGDQKPLREHLQRATDAETAMGPPPATGNPAAPEAPLLALAAIARGPRQRGWNAEAVRALVRLRDISVDIEGPKNAVTARDRLRELHAKLLEVWHGPRATEAARRHRVEVLDGEMLAALELMRSARAVRKPGVSAAPLLAAMAAADQAQRWRRRDRATNPHEPGSDTELGLRWAEFSLVVVPGVDAARIAEARKNASAVHPGLNYDDVWRLRPDLLPEIGVLTWDLEREMSRQVKGMFGSRDERPGGSEH